MSPADLVIRGAVLTDAGFGPRTVSVRDGRVVGIEETAVQPVDPVGAEVVVLADDEVLIPGLVDTHVHINEPGRTHWEGFATASRAAAAGGVTTILDMPLNSIPATTSVEALETKRQAAEGQCVVDVGLWGGAVPASLGSLEELWRAGVYGFKCFLLDSGVPEFPALDTDQLRRAMAEIAGFGGLLVVHAEDPDVIAAHARAHTRQYREFLGSRPPAAEQRAIDTVLDAASRSGCRTHIVHLSSAAALPALAAARRRGVPVTVETCPHYLTLTAEEIADGQTQYKCCPPVREAANQDRLWEGLADGVIDFIVSDHSPSTPDLKLFDSGDFGAAWGGISSLQLGLSLVLTRARRHGVGLAQVVRWMATRPAEIVGVEGKGSVAVGGSADFAVLAPDQSYVVDAATLEHRHPVSPYQDRVLTGVVRATYLHGRRVSVGDEPRGTLLSRGD